MSTLNDGSDTLHTDGSVDLNLKTALDDSLEELGATSSSTDFRMANAAATAPLSILDGRLPLVALQRGLATLQGDGGQSGQLVFAVAWWTTKVPQRLQRAGPDDRGRVLDCRCDRSSATTHCPTRGGGGPYAPRRNLARAAFLPHPQQPLPSWIVPWQG